MIIVCWPDGCPQTQVALCFLVLSWDFLTVLYWMSHLRMFILHNVILNNCFLKGQFFTDIFVWLKGLTMIWENILFSQDIDLPSRIFFIFFSKLNFLKSSMLRVLNTKLSAQFDFFYNERLYHCVTLCIDFGITLNYKEMYCVNLNSVKGRFKKNVDQALQ